MLHAGVGGTFRLKIEKGDAQGKPLPNTARHFEVPNMVLDNGLEMMKCGATGNALENTFYINLGVGSTPVAPTDLALASFLTSGRVSTDVGPSDVTAAVPWCSLAASVTFAQGAVVGNVSEMGASPLVNPENNLFSRALLQDASGNPTTVSCTDIDIVTVSYELRLYVSLATVDKTFVVDGTTYTVTEMWGALDPALARQWFTGGQYGSQSGRFQNNGSGGYHAFTTDVGAPGTRPSVLNGTMTGSSLTVTDAPTVGEYWTDIAGAIPATSGSLGGIIGLCVCTNATGAVPSVRIKNAISPAIDKSDLQELSITSRISWGRYTG